MVLQRGVPVVIWGWADAGEKIFVRVGASEKSVVGGDGWDLVIVLDPVDTAREPVRDAGDGE